MTSARDGHSPVRTAARAGAGARLRIRATPGGRRGQRTRRKWNRRRGWAAGSTRRWWGGGGPRCSYAPHSGSLTIGEPCGSLARPWTARPGLAAHAADKTPRHSPVLRTGMTPHGDILQTGREAAGAQPLERTRLPLHPRGGPTHHLERIQYAHTPSPRTEIEISPSRHLHPAAPSMTRDHRSRHASHHTRSPLCPLGHRLLR